MRDDLAAMFRDQFLRRRLADFAAPAADMDLGAELEQAFGHFLAEAGAASGHENAFALHQAVAEHEFAGIHIILSCFLFAPFMGYEAAHSN